jgi:protein-disulfide isomerase
MSKRTLLYLGLATVAAIAFFWFTKPSASDAPGSTASASKHVKGTSPAGVTLIEYGDFECPACGAYYPLLKQLFEQYKDTVVFQFRHFPLDQQHQNARAGSRAAEAAGNQGKFWEMHDKLYEGQRDWSGVSNPSAIFESYAQSIGLDMDRYRKDFPTKELNAIINADIVEGQKIKANSTPTFVLDGVKIDNPREVATFQKVLDDAIKKKGGTPPAATPATPPTTPAPDPTPAPTPSGQ